MHRLSPLHATGRQVAKPPALAVAVLALGLALGGCKSVRDVTGSIGATAAVVPDQGPKLNRFVEEWGRRYDAAPDRKDVALTYAQALRNAHRVTEATAVLQRLAARHPNDREVLAAYGKSLVDAGRLQQARTVLQGAHTPERPNWSVLSAQGSVADQMGDHEAARDYYQAALKIVPDEPSVLSNLGLSYALSKNLAAAEQALQRASAQPRADARVRQNYSLVLALQGKFSEAEKVQRMDVPPAQASANVTAIRNMIAQSNTWKEIQDQASRRR